MNRTQYEISNSVICDVAYLICADKDVLIWITPNVCYKSNSKMKKNVKSEKFKNICV